MDQPASGNYHNDDAMATSADAKPTASTGYPVAYFLCDGVTEKMLKASPNHTHHIQAPR